MFEGEKHRMERESEYFWHYLITGFNISLEAVNHAPQTKRYTKTNTAMLPNPLIWRRRFEVSQCEASNYSFSHLILSHLSTGAIRNTAMHKFLMRHLTSPEDRRTKLQTVEWFLYWAKSTIRFRIALEDTSTCRLLVAMSSTFERIIDSSNVISGLLFNLHQSKLSYGKQNDWNQEKQNNLWICVLVVSYHQCWILAQRQTKRWRL